MPQSDESNARNVSTKIVPVRLRARMCVCVGVCARADSALLARVDGLKVLDTLGPDGG